MGTDGYLEYEGPLYEYHADAIGNMLKMANSNQKPVRTVFNKIEIIVEPGADVKAVARSYGEARHQAQYTAQVRRVERLTEKLEHLDFNNQGAILDWLVELSGPWREGIDMPRQMIVNTIKQKGYQPSTAPSQPPTNKKDYATWVISQAIVCLADPLGYYMAGSLPDLVKRWHRM